MKKIALVSDNNLFCKFLEESFSGEIVNFPNMEDAGKAALNEPFEAIVVTARTGEILTPLSLEGQKTYAKLWEKGQKVYAEMYDLQDSFLSTLFGFRVYGRERAVYKEVFVWKDTILQATNAAFQPGVAVGGDVLVRAENCIGSHTPVIAGNESFPVLVANKGFLYSAVRLSIFERFTMLPNRRWKALFSEVFSKLLDEDICRIEKAFEKIWPDMKLSGEGNTIENAVRRAVDWHFNSGIMSDASGKSGCYEMIRSADLNVKYGQRVDTMLLTAALLCTAGKFMNESGWEKVGTNLATHCFDAKIQIENGANSGVFRWFDHYGVTINGAVCYASDNGRDGMAMLQLYRVTGEERYLESLKRLGDAYLRGTEGKPYLKATAFSINETDLEKMKRITPDCNSPVYYDGMAIVLANLYRITGDMRYKNQLKLTADAMVKDYPDFSTNFTPLTKNFVYSRLIIVLCAAQEIGCGDYSGLINELLCVFEKLQDVSGGVKEEGLVMAEHTYTHEEFSVSMGKEHDKIMDMLYCFNNLMGCFSVIRNMTNPIGIKRDIAERMREKMMSLLLKIQIAEEDNRLNGAWMRAYDMENGEYYGVTKDLAWGPYCIMGGWIMGFLPLLLLEEKGAMSIYSIVKNYK